MKPKRPSAGSLAESLLASHLRALGIPFEPQYRWHPERKFRADFALLAPRILVEVEGGVFIGGRHTRGLGFEADCRKHLMAAERGWRVLRVTPRMIRDGTAAGALVLILGDSGASEKEQLTAR